MADSGRNKGLTGGTLGTVSGLIDLVPLGGTYSFPQMQVQITGFGAALTSELHKLFGPGDGQVPTYYGSVIEGGGQAHGKVQSAQSPFPPTLYNLKGTLTLQADAGCTIAMPATIRKIACAKQTETQETWTVDIDWVKSGPHTVVWNGTAVSYVQPTLANHENNEGSFRVDDPNYLVTAADTHLFFPTMNGTASAYQETASAALIQTYLATATPPRANLKVVTSQAIRIDDNAVMLLVHWGLNSTKDERELPATVTALDPLNLQSHATIGRVNATASSLANFALRETASVQLTAGGTGNYFTTTSFGLRNTAEDITFPGTFTVTDANDLDTKAAYTVVSNNSAPTYSAPTGLKIVDKKTVQLTSALGTNNQYQTVWTLAKNDSRDERIIPQTFTILDPNSLNHQASVSAIDATPTLPAGLNLKAVHSRTQVLTGDSAHTQTTIVGALRNTVDELLFPKTMEYRSANSPWKSAIPFTVTASGTMLSQASSLWAAFQGTSNAWGLTLIPQTDNTRVVVYEYADPGKLVEGYTTGGGRWLKGRVSGGNVQVYVATNRAYGSGQRKVQLAQQWVYDKPIRRFLVRRMIPGTTTPEYATQIGTVNSGTFLGLSAGTALYEGPQYSANIGLSGTINFFMGYQFHADSAGVVQGMPDNWFRQPILLSTSFTGSGWVNASSLGLTDVVAPDTSSFDVFLA